jgi:hypothetical protein
MERNDETPEARVTRIYNESQENIQNSANWNRLGVWVMGTFCFLVLFGIFLLLMWVAKLIWQM